MHPRVILRSKGKVLVILQYSRRFGKTLVLSTAKRTQAYCEHARIPNKVKIERSDWMAQGPR